MRPRFGPDDETSLGLAESPYLLEGCPILGRPSWRAAAEMPVILKQALRRSPQAKSRHHDIRSLARSTTPQRRSGSRPHRTV